MDFRMIQEIVAQVLQISPDDVGMDKHFEKDLGANSLDRVEIVMNLEGRLGIAIPDEDLEGIETVADAVEKIQKLL